jgi:hypothetical protein
MREPDRTEPPLPGDRDDRQPPKIGAALLKLRNALMRAEQCRQMLNQQDFSHERWMEIVTDVHPDLRFMVRPQILDAILKKIQSAGKPVSRAALARELVAQKVGTIERVRHCIITSLRTGKLSLFANNTIGLPEWKKIKTR